MDNEVTASKQGTGTFNIGFTNCLWKVKTAPTGVTVAGMIAGSDPMFDSINVSRNYYDFHLKAGSPAIDKGVATGLTVDLDGNPRVVGAGPDLGSYERQ
ncbi:choice-of-anchor Q domain-containing protein [Puia sp. P3]|uniref:choice-of-anchor Q domain-containing protein n=1 Tax=Puia sp. P3 TaxID=3423952 RepID=UPI003D6750CD